MFSKNFSKMRTIDESKLIYAYIEQGMKANCIPCFSNVYGVLFVDVLLTILNDNAFVAVGNLLSCKIVQGR